MQAPAQAPQQAQICGVPAEVHLLEPVLGGGVLEFVRVHRPGEWVPATLALDLAGATATATLTLDLTPTLALAIDATRRTGATALALDATATAPTLALDLTGATATAPTLALDLTGASATAPKAPPGYRKCFYCI